MSGQFTRLLKAVTALRVTPMTNLELCDKAGCNRDTARMYTHAMHQAGLIYIKAWRFSDCKDDGARGPRMAVWDWQPDRLFGKPDAPRPMSRPRLAVGTAKPASPAKPKPPKPPRAQKGEERKVVIRKAGGFKPPEGVARSVFELGGL